MSRLTQALSYRKQSAGRKVQESEGGQGEPSSEWLKFGGQRLSRTSSSNGSQPSEGGHKTFKEKKRPPALNLVAKHVEEMERRQLQRAQSETNHQSKAKSLKAGLASRLFRSSSMGTANTIAPKRQGSFSEKVLGKLSSLATRKPQGNARSKSPARRKSGSSSKCSGVVKQNQAVRLHTPRKAVGIGRTRAANTIDSMRRPSPANSHSSCESPCDTAGAGRHPRRRAQTPRAAPAVRPRTSAPRPAREEASLDKGRSDDDMSRSISPGEAQLISRLNQASLAASGKREDIDLSPILPHTYPADSSSSSSEGAGLPPMKKVGFNASFGAAHRLASLPLPVHAPKPVASHRRLHGALKASTVDNTHQDPPSTGAPVHIGDRPRTRGHRSLAEMDLPIGSVAATGPTKSYRQLAPAVLPEEAATRLEGGGVRAKLPERARSAVMQMEEEEAPSSPGMGFRWYGGRRR